MAAKAPTAERAALILKQLKKAYPNAVLALRFSTPFELLTALILAAQCTDERVNQLTSALLFNKYKTPQDYVATPSAEVENDVRSTGFFRQKTRALQNCSAKLIDSFKGRVPDTLEELLTLPGVGRKTANILLGNAFGKPAIGVDTHVNRLSQRLGLSTQTDPDKIEADLNQIIPLPERTRFCNVIQMHGRRVCVARKPLCPQCVVADLCPYPDKTQPVEKPRTPGRLVHAAGLRAQRPRPAGRKP